MALDLLDFDPNRLAAILYRAEDDVDTLLADFAGDLLRSGERIGGIVQRNTRDHDGKQAGMQVVDLMTGREIVISQALGAGSAACKLDASGLAEATRVVRAAIEDEVSLIIVNKFSKQEAAGRGFRSEIADAIAAGRALLTAVPETCIDAWKDFTGDRGTTLLCARRIVDAWWEEVSTREALLRGAESSRRTPHPRSLEMTSRS
jgi:molybdate transport system ATP-binding protein